MRTLAIDSSIIRATGRRAQEKAYKAQESPVVCYEGSNAPELRLDALWANEAMERNADLDHRTRRAMLDNNGEEAARREKQILAFEEWQGRFLPHSLRRLVTEPQENHSCADVLLEQDADNQTIVTVSEVIVVAAWIVMLLGAIALIVL